MTFYHTDQAATLAAVWKLTPEAARRWLACEGQAVDNPTNALNIRWYGRTLQTGRIGGFATYRNPGASFIDGLEMVKALAPNYGYGELIASLGGGDTYHQCRAIERSSWAAGHYGSTPTTAGCVSHGLPIPVPTPPRTQVMYLDPTVIPPKVCDLKPGGTLYREDANGHLVLAWDGPYPGASGVGYFGVQPHAEPPRPPTAAPLGFLLMSAGGGANPFVGMYGDDLIINVRDRGA